MKVNLVLSVIHRIYSNIIVYSHLNPILYSLLEPQLSIIIALVICFTLHQLIPLFMIMNVNEITST